MYSALQSLRRVCIIKKCLAAALLPDEWLLIESLKEMKDLQLALSAMTLTDYIYASLSIQTFRVTLQTDDLINSEASANFISTAFTQALRFKPLNLVSLRVMRADSSEISSAENEFFFFLSVAVNRNIPSLHLFCIINFSHWIILELLWLQTANFTINWQIKEVMIKNSNPKVLLSYNLYICYFSEAQYYSLTLLCNLLSQELMKKEIVS